MSLIFSLLTGILNRSESQYLAPTAEEPFEQLQRMRLGQPVLAQTRGAPFAIPEDERIGRVEDMQALFLY